MTDDNWRLVDADGWYEVSRFGDVRSWHTRGPGKRRASVPQNVIGSVNREGYRQVLLSLNGRKRKHSVHILVAEAWIGPRPAGQQVRHRDGVRANCCASNLRYGTPVQNAADRVEHGTDPAGERNPRAVLDRGQVEEVRRRYVAGDERDGAAALARELGVARQTIGRIVRGETWPSDENKETP